MGSFRTVAIDLLSWLPDPYENSSSTSTTSRSRPRSQSRPGKHPITTTTTPSTRSRARSQPPPLPTKPISTSQHSQTKLKKQQQQPSTKHRPPHQHNRSHHSTPRPQAQQLRHNQPQPSALDDLSYLYRAAKKRLLNNMREVDPLIDQYTHIQEMPQADEALLHLRKIASCVKPIMRKRGWRVGTLSEFYPDQRNLLGLNVNRGQSILVRLRHPDNRSRFLPFEATLDTMLHELCHIVQGPHDAAFNALWQELRDEWEALTLKGYTGEGFLSKGQKVGGAIIPRDEMRRRARVEAAKRDHRRQQDRVKQGHRVGGSRPTPGYEPRDAAAAATIRRTTAGTAAVTEGCGTGSKMATQAAADAQLNGFRTKEEMDQANEMAIQQAAIELMAQEEERVLEQKHRTKTVAPPISDGLVWDAINGLQPAPSSSSSTPIPRAPSAPAKVTPSSVPPPVPKLSRPSVTNQSSSVRATSYPGRKEYEVHHTGRPLSRLVAENEEKQRQKKASKQPMASTYTRSATASSSSRTWQCSKCTLINDINSVRCGACDAQRLWASNTTQRPASVPVGSTSTSMRTSTFKDMEWCCMWCGNWMEQKWWTCDVCGHMKDQS